METLKKPALRGVRRLFHRFLGTKKLTQNGIMLSTDASSVPKTVRYGIFGGVYEAAEAHLISSCLKPGDRVLEIGAGTGFISLLAAHICGAKNVHSFEANPAMEAIIRGNYALNGIEPHLNMKAVTVDGGPLTFHSADNVVSSSIYERDVEGKKITVESMAIDDLLRDLSPTTIVMDVEGAEIELLASDQLSSVNNIIVELHPHIVGEHQIQKMLDKLALSGFNTKARMNKNILLARG